MHTSPSCYSYTPDQGSTAGRKMQLNVEVEKSGCIVPRARDSIEVMKTTPRYRLEKIKETMRGVPASPKEMAQWEVNIDCAVEISEALVGLTVAVQSMEQNSVIVMNKLITEIKGATAQAVISSDESSKVAKESTKLSGQLNWLTKWIIGAAVLSAIAAAIQAYAALYPIIK
jgi:hypothetical protein